MLLGLLIVIQKHDHFCGARVAIAIAIAIACKHAWNDNIETICGKISKRSFFFFFTCSEQYQYHVKTHKDNISNCRETAAVVTLSEGQIAI